MRITALIGFTLLLTACGSPSVEKDGRFSEHDDKLTITTDKVSGCKYIVLLYDGGYDGAGGITPLLRNDGTHVCTEKEER